jgi:glucan phosphoethanolaminetransferase (alkaline phosphatase superfamily)
MGLGRQPRSDSRGSRLGEPLTVDVGRAADAVSSDSATSLAKNVLRRVWEAARGFFTFCVRHPTWTACMAVFIATWTIELYMVQQITLVFPNELGSRFAMWAPKIRLVLDLLFISMLTVVLRRRWLVVITIVSFFVYLGLLTYFKYFLKPLSLLTILSTWREAVQVGGFALDMFPRGPAVVLLGSLSIKLSALVLSRRVSLPRASAWLAGAVLLMGYLGLSSVAVYLDPLDAILTTRGVGRLGYIRGYLGPWFAEWYYLRDDQLLQQALEVRKRVYDRITPLEADIPIHNRLVIIQAESLDTNILGFHAEGQEVTPFLNRLREESMFFRVQTTHVYASADADFTVLNGVRPSQHGNTYSLHGYPYQDTTPQILSDCGFETYVFHGNSGEFYNRREPYGKMGFAGLLFSEELVARYDLKADRWGIRDADVLRVSAQELRTAAKPTCHFVITLTTHTPYTLLDKSEMEIYPDPSSTVEHYVNNMRYLDSSLRDYITSLGRGTTVVIYADHPTEDFEGFVCDRELEVNKQFIPFFIYDTDQDLSQLQQTRDNPESTNGTWNLVDVANYLRGQIKRSRGRSPADDGIKTSEPEHERPAEK